MGQSLSLSQRSSRTNNNKITVLHSSNRANVRADTKVRLRNNASSHRNSNSIEDKFLPRCRDPVHRNSSHNNNSSSSRVLPVDGHLRDNRHRDDPLINSNSNVSHGNNNSHHRNNNSNGKASHRSTISTETTAAPHRDNMDTANSRVLLHRTSLSVKTHKKR